MPPEPGVRGAHQEQKQCASHGAPGAPPAPTLRDGQVPVDRPRSCPGLRLQAGTPRRRGRIGRRHMSLSSESLAFLLKFDWGFDTLMVNGRFRTSPRDYKRAMKTFYIGPLNNTGRYLHPRTLRSEEHT